MDSTVISQSAALSTVITVMVVKHCQKFVDGICLSVVEHFILDLIMLVNNSESPFRAAYIVN